MYNPGEEQKKEYQDYVKQVTPTHSLWKNMAKAFLTGGIICVIGQGIMNCAQTLGMDREAAGAWTSIVLVLLSVLLTGFNIYPGIAKFGGAGALVPITGFANSVAAPALEFRREGLVLGVGAKLFAIAGPVLTYGIASSMAVGLVFWIIRTFF